MRTKNFTVQINRTYCDYNVDFDVKAKSEKEAKEKALKIAKKNPDFFGDAPDPDYWVSFCEKVS